MATSAWNLGRKKISFSGKFLVTDWPWMTGGEWRYEGWGIAAMDSLLNGNTSQVVNTDYRLLSISLPFQGVDRQCLTKQRP